MHQSSSVIDTRDLLDRARRRQGEDVALRCTGPRIFVFHLEGGAGALSAVNCVAGGAGINGACRDVFGEDGTLEYLVGGFRLVGWDL